MLLDNEYLFIDFFSITQHLRWRSEHGIDEKIDLQKDIEGWRSDFLLMFDGRDKSGRPCKLHKL